MAGHTFVENQNRTWDIEGRGNIVLNQGMPTRGRKLLFIFLK